MDDAIVERIFELVRRSEGIKARDIAKKLNVSRKEVNKVLYGRLAKVCVQDEQYLWYCHSEHSSGKPTSLNDIFTKMEETFSNADFTVEELEAFLSAVEN